MGRYVGQFVTDLHGSPRLEGALEGRTEFGVGKRVGDANRKRQRRSRHQRIVLRRQLEADHIYFSAVEDVAGAVLAVRQRGPPEDVPVVVEEAGDLGVPALALQPGTRLVVEALLGLGVVGRPRAGRPKALMNPHEQIHPRGRVVIHAHPGDDPGHPALAHSGGAVGAIGVVRSVIDAGKADGLVADTRDNRPIGHRDRVLNVEGPRGGIAHAVRLAPRRSLAHQLHQASDHPVAILVLESVLLVGMVSDARLDTVSDLAGRGLDPEDGLNALRVVGSVVRPDLQRVGLAVRTPQHGELLRKGFRVGHHRADPGPEDALQLVPVAAEVIAIESRADVYGVRWLDVVLELILLLIALEHVFLRRGVAAIRRRAEVLVRDPEVGGVGGLIVVAHLGAEGLVDRGVGARVRAQLHEEVLEVVPGAASPIHLLEAVGPDQVALTEPTEIPVGVADHALESAGTVLTPAEAGAHRQAVRDRLRDQIERSADRTRTVLDLTGALAHLDRFHAPGDREIVGRRRRVGGGSDEDPVLHQRDFGGALRAGAAEADVRPEAEPLFLLDIHPGKPEHRLVDIRVHAGSLADLLF